MANEQMSKSEIMTMQQDAIRRVREMQQVAQQRVRGNNRPNNSNNNTHNQDINNNHFSESKPIEIHNNEPEKSTTFLGIFDKLDLDSETIMIGILILVLLNEGVDIMLILALCYLLF